jgi:hypothetical protein
MGILKQKCPMYLRDVTFKTETVDGETRRIVALSFRLEPFTREMANSLGIGYHLFSSDSGEPHGDFIAGTYGIAVPLQEIDIAAAPDAPVTLTLRDVKVSGSIAVRKDKENPVLSANLAISFAYPEAKELLFLAMNVNNQLFCTFENQQMGLGLDAPKEPALRPGVQGEFDDQGSALVN